MDLQRVAHRRLSHAGRADGDDAVDHGAAVSWLLAAAGAAGMEALWLQCRMMYIAAVPVLRAVGTHAEPRLAPASRKLDTKRVFRDFLARAWAYTGVAGPANISLSLSQ